MSTWKKQLNLDEPEDLLTFFHRVANDAWHDHNNKVPRLIGKEIIKRAGVSRYRQCHIRLAKYINQTIRIVEEAKDEESKKKEVPK